VTRRTGNGLGALAFTTGFLLGPAGGAAALSAGWGTGLFAVMTLACLIAAVAALRLGRHLPTPPDPPPAQSPAQPCLRHPRTASLAP
jgi:hypothetical protein